jgi:glycine betaine/proline transport system ATP-binding protein
MKSPGAIIYSKDGPRVAVRKMKEASISSIFVMDKEHHLKGIITIDAAMNLLKSENQDLESIINKDISTVSPDASIQDLLPLAVRSKYPIVVVDEDRKLLGIIAKVSVLAGILGEEAVNVCWRICRVTD